MRAPLVLAGALGLTVALPSQATRGVDDGLSCHGRLVNLKETPTEVAAKCGEPVSSRSYRRPLTGYRWVAVLEWRYESTGSFARILTFEAGHLVSIVAVGRWEKW